MVRGEFGRLLARLQSGRLLAQQSDAAVRVGGTLQTRLLAQTESQAEFGHRAAGQSKLRGFIEVDREFIPVIVIIA